MRDSQRDIADTAETLFDYRLDIGRIAYCANEALSAYYAYFRMGTPFRAIYV